MTLPSRPTLDKELANLNNNTLRLSSLANEAIADSMQALADRNVTLALNIVARDEEINRLRFEIEEYCQFILATQQPAATDLRVVLTALHIANELERIADHAAGIARLVARLQDEANFDSLHKLPKMAKRARQMVDQGVNAFVQRNMEAARELTRKDNKIDKHYHRLVTETLDEMRSEDYVMRATYLIWCGHNLERIGDRATNIAERVIFMVSGEYVENVVELD